MNAPVALQHGESLLELYLSVGAASLTYTQQEGQFMAELPIAIALRPTAEAAPTGASTTPLLDETTQLPFSVADTSGPRPAGCSKPA